MGLTITPELEGLLRSNAAAEGISVEEYLSRLIKSDQQAASEFNALITEAINSGDLLSRLPGIGKKSSASLNED